eukprot:g28269.t1
MQRLFQLKFRISWLIVIDRIREDRGHRTHMLSLPKGGFYLRGFIPVKMLVSAESFIAVLFVSTPCKTPLTFFETFSGALAIRQLQAIAYQYHCPLTLNLYLNQHHQCQHHYQHHQHGQQPYHEILSFFLFLDLCNYVMSQHLRPFLCTEQFIVQLFVWRRLWLKCAPATPLVVGQPHPTVKRTEQLIVQLFVWRRLWLKRAPATPLVAQHVPVTFEQYEEKRDAEDRAKAKREMEAALVFNTQHQHKHNKHLIVILSRHLLGTKLWNATKSGTIGTKINKANTSKGLFFDVKIGCEKWEYRWAFNNDTKKEFLKFLDVQYSYCIDIGSVSQGNSVPPLADASTETPANASTSSNTTCTSTTTSNVNTSVSNAKELLHDLAGPSHGGRSSHGGCICRTRGQKGDDDARAVATLQKRNIP